MCMVLNYNIDFLRNTNQDGLENLFGGVKLNCQNSKSPTPIHFRSAYITTILNNLTVSNSMKSNCEKDNSTPLLRNFDRIMLKSKNAVPKASYEMIDFYDEQFSSDLISFDPQLPEINVIETEELNYLSSLVLDRLLKNIDCELCINSLQTVSKESVDDILSLNSRPSATFILNFKKVWFGMNGLLPNLCAERPLKKILVYNVNDIILDNMGCRKHNEKIKTELLDITAIQAIKEFCKTINDLLSKKTNVLPEQYKGIQIYEVALSFRKSNKKVGKYTDLFEEI